MPSELPPALNVVLCQLESLQDHGKAVDQNDLVIHLREKIRWTGSDSDVRKMLELGASMEMCHEKTRGMWKYGRKTQTSHGSPVTRTVKKLARKRLPNLGVVLHILNLMNSSTNEGYVGLNDLASKVKAECPKWKVNELEAQDYVRQLLYIGLAQNLCYEVGNESCWKLGYKPTSERPTQSIYSKQIVNDVPQPGSLEYNRLPNLGTVLHNLQYLSSTHPSSAVAESSLARRMMRQCPTWRITDPAIAITYVRELLDMGQKQNLCYECDKGVWKPGYKPRRLTGKTGQKIESERLSDSKIDKPKIVEKKEEKRVASKSPIRERVVRKSEPETPSESKTAKRQSKKELASKSPTSERVSRSSVKESKPARLSKPETPTQRGVVEKQLKKEVSWKSPARQRIASKSTVREPKPLRLDEPKTPAQTTVADERAEIELAPIVRPVPPTPPPSPVEYNEPNAIKNQLSLKESEPASTVKEAKLAKRTFDTKYMPNPLKVKKVTRHSEQPGIMPVKGKELIQSKPTAKKPTKENDQKSRTTIPASWVGQPRVTNEEVVHLMNPNRHSQCQICRFIYQFPTPRKPYYTSQDLVGPHDFVRFNKRVPDEVQKSKAPGVPCAGMCHQTGSE